MKVLVVDDDRDQRELRSLLLVQNGFDAVQAADRASARNLAAEHHPAAAIIDLGLPTHADGLALLRELRAIDEKIHMVVLTGSPRKTVEHELDGFPIDELFVKPAATAELLRRLRSFQKVEP